MRILFKILVVGILVLVSSCKKQVGENEEQIKARVPVDVVAITKGVIKDELALFANTLYLKRNVVAAPIPSFITRVSVNLGDRVKEGQELYTLETKERRVLGDQTIMPDSLSASYGILIVRAPSTGVVTALDKQQVGDYVLEGAPLCTISENSTLVFAVNVPYEYIRFAKTGMKCILMLPDNSQYTAKFTVPLTTMNTVSQTQTILATADHSLFLPENLLVKVLINKSDEASQQLLPRKAVLADEMMEEFWVMKLENDSTAIKIKITPGTMDSKFVKILSPTFQPDDQFLISGNYGLPDTAYVRVNP